jgi:hypothetical protein
MADTPTPEETARWQRRLAAQANNRAWTLAENPQRTPQEDREMLSAAHAALHLWRIVGNGDNVAHAEQLVGHVCAFLGDVAEARHYTARSFAHFTRDAAAPWEQAFAHAIAAHIAARAGDGVGHRAAYDEAAKRVAALEIAEERQILEASLRVIPAPAG